MEALIDRTVHFIFTRYASDSRNQAQLIRRADGIRASPCPSRSNAPHNRHTNSPPLVQELLILRDTTHLVEWVGAGSPPGEEERQADGLKGAGKCADSDGIEWALLGEDLSDELWHY